MLLGGWACGRVDFEPTDGATDPADASDAGPFIAGHREAWIGTNLTLEGELDWVHWGLSSVTDINRKSNVVPQINGFTVLGPGAGLVQFNVGTVPGLSWTDGTPTATTPGASTGVALDT